MDEGKANIANIYFECSRKWMPSLQSLIITREDVGLYSRQEVLPARTESQGSEEDWDS